MAWRIALDRGGTFTDVVAEADDGRVVVEKVATDAAGSGHDAAIEAIRRIVGAPAGEPIPRRLVASVRCGTTAATNALLERRGEPCALLVTRGFADLLVIGTQERPDLFALHVVRTPPLAARVFEIGERVLADGTVREALDEEGVRAAARTLRTAGLRSAAVLFLHAFAYPEHELRAAEVLRAEGIEHVVTSHEAAREIGAVPRGETACADAYLTPVLRRSLRRLRDAFAPDVDVRFMQSHGGLADAAHARGPAAILSGPAGGALAVARVLAAAGEEHGIGFDMGGTSTDVCRVTASPEMRYESRVGGLRLRVPALRVHTVAAGGGSILSFDGRRLLVGPESAGASPGPAGYGLGGPATVTDADAVLGRLVPSAFPACFGKDGRQPFDVDASRSALAPLAAAAALSIEDAAAGFVRVADELVAQAIREESVLRGIDVRTHPLVAFGGAGPQHACAVARALGAPFVLISRRSSVLSAWGIAGAQPAHEEVRALLRPLDDDGLAAAHAAADELSSAARAALARQGVGGMRVGRAAELRVAGVDAAILVPLGTLAEARASFEDAHRRLYGFVPPDAAIEILNVRVRAEGIEDAPTARAEQVAVAPASPPQRFAGVPVHRLDALTESVDGPALVVDAVTTIVVERGWQLRPLANGLLRMDPTVTPPTSGVTTRLNPVSLALFANAFMSAAERMGAVLERVSHSTNIKERLDFSCALFDGEGRLVANAPHVPVHLGAMGESVRAIAAARGRDLREGDAFLTNDPYAGGSHLPDITLVTPVLVEDGRARFFVANRAHHADVGGISPGSMPPHSTSIDEEGVRLHDFLVVRDGVLHEADVRRAFATARNVDERVADLRAQAAANAEGARLLSEMCAVHTPDVVSAWMEHVLDDGEAAMRELLATLPAGTHVREDTLDDGTPLRVAITIADENATIDFAGTGPRGGTNLHAPRAVVRAAVLYAFRTLVRRPVPLNEGCLRPLTIRIPAGSLLDPHPPDAVVGGNVETSQLLVDLVLGALGACAASQGTMNNVTFGSLSPNGGAGAYYETLGGGTGAGPSFDGASAIQCHMTNTRITDVEVVERRFPVVIRRFAVRSGSGGDGAHPGGDGLVREIEFLTDAEMGVLSQRRVRGAPGLAGGGSGLPGRNTLVARDGDLQLPGRATGVVHRGDVLRIETPGGGGYGVR